MATTYAKLISETTIDTTLPKKAYDDQGRLVTGGLENRPGILVKLGFYPLVESEMPSEVIEGHHYEKRYAQENNTIVQSWISVENPSLPTKTYSKLKILIAADEAGFVEQLMDVIESDRKIQFIWDASNTIEDNELLSQYIEIIANGLKKTENEIRTFLDEHCIAE